MNIIVNHLDAELQRIQMLKPTELCGLEVYSGRALCLTEPGDVIQLVPMLMENWAWITEHYLRISLAHTTQVIWDDRFEILGDFPNHEVSAFIFSPELNRVREDVRWLSAVEQMNSKNKFIKLCEELGIRVPKTWRFLDKENIRGLSFPYPVYLKAATSVSGLGVAYCASQEDLELQIADMSAGEFQIQEALLEAIFLNLTYSVRNGKLGRIVSTRQILKGFSHDGNIFPSGESDPWHITDPIAERIFQGGMRGVFGFDVAVTPSGCFAIECNPRFNGSVYPAITAGKLGINEWFATNVATRCNTLDGVRLGPLEYNKNTKKGVVVVNWGAVVHNKIGVLVAASGDEERQWYIDELKRVLS